MVELDKESDLSQRDGMVAEREVCERDFMVDQQGSLLIILSYALVD